jgi:hypothetical protein
VPVRYPINKMIEKENSTISSPIIANVIVCLELWTFFGSPPDVTNPKPAYTIKKTAANPTNINAALIKLLNNIGIHLSVATPFWRQLSQL